MIELRKLYERQSRGYLFSALNILKSNKFAMTAIVILSIVVISGVFPSYVSPYNPYQMHTDQTLLDPGGKYVLGTDMFGRDTLSRIVWGARVSILVGGVSVGIALAFGTLIGMLAGFYGKMLDEIIMRIVDGMLVFPDVFVGLIIMALLGNGMENVMLAVGIVITPGFARVVRGSVLSERGKDYVLASRSLGKSDRHIIFREILPNCMAPLTVQATICFGYAILYEAFFSFLGLGVQPPTPSWGNLVNLGVRFMRSDPWLSVFPGMAILLTVMALNILGDGLRDAFDPRLRVE